MEPKWTLASIVNTLREATVKAIKGTGLNERRAKEGAEPPGRVPSMFRCMMEKKSTTCAEMIKTAGIKLD